MRRKFFAALVPLLFTSAIAVAQQGEFYVKPLVEKKVTELPDGELYWHVSTFESIDQAQTGGGAIGISRRVRWKGLAVHSRTRR